MNVIQFGVGKWGANHARILGQRAGHTIKRVTFASEFDWEDKVRNMAATYDAAVITSPSETHYTLLKHCFRAGVPVYCEKPFALTEQQIKSLANIKAIDQIFMVGHQMTFLDMPKWDKITGIIALRAGAIPRTEGACRSLMVHDLSIAQYLSGADEFIPTWAEGDRHAACCSFEARRKGKVVIASVTCYAQSLAHTRLRHFTVIGDGTEIGSTVQTYTPDNWNREDVLARALDEFIAATAADRQPERNGWDAAAAVTLATIRAEERLCNK